MCWLSISKARYISEALAAFYTVIVLLERRLELSRRHELLTLITAASRVRGCAKNVSPTFAFGLLVIEDLSSLKILADVHGCASFAIMPIHAFPKLKEMILDQMLMRSIC